MFISFSYIQLSFSIGFQASSEVKASGLGSSVLTSGLSISVLPSDIDLSVLSVLPSLTGQILTVHLLHVDSQVVLSLCFILAVRTVEWFHF